MFSWKSPRLAVPSPKLHTQTRSECCCLNASAAPVAVPMVVPRSPATHGTTPRWNGPLNATERPVGRDGGGLGVAGRLAEHLGDETPELGTPHQIHHERVPIMRCSRVVGTKIDEAADVDGFLAFDGKPPHVQLAERGPQRPR